MKKKILLLLFLLPMLFAQGVKGQGYVPLVDTNKTWSTMTEMIDFFHTYWTKFTDDTIIGGQTYKKVIIMDSVFFAQGKLLGYIREDSSKKVFYMNTLFEEGLIYDFDVNQGDTIIIYNRCGNPFYDWNGGDNYYKETLSVIDSVYYSSMVDLNIVDFLFYVDTIHFSDNINRKIIVVRNIDESVDFYERGTEIWIEGIGSIAGVLESSNYLNYEFLLGAKNILLCYFYDDNIIYSFPYYHNGNCYWSILKTEEYNTSAISVFPNPCSEQLNLRFQNPTHDKLSIEFISHTGKVVYSDNIFNIESYSLNISNFASGLYLLRLTDRQQMQTFKIIVAH